MSAAPFDQILDALAEALAERIAARQAPPTGPRLLGIPQAAEYLGRSQEAIKHLIADGSIPVVRSDRRVFLDRLDLDKWIERNKE